MDFFAAAMWLSNFGGRAGGLPTFAAVDRGSFAELTAVVVVYVVGTFWAAPRVLESDIWCLGGGVNYLSREYCKNETLSEWNTAYSLNQRP